MRLEQDKCPGSRSADWTFSLIFFFKGKKQEKKSNWTLRVQAQLNALCVNLALPMLTTFYVPSYSPPIPQVPNADYKQSRLYM